MGKSIDRSPRFSTSSFGTTPDVTPKELAALGRHLGQCDRQRGALFAIKSAAQAVDEFASPRLITIFLMFALVSTLVCLVW